MKALLLDTRNDKHFVGDTYEELATATGRVTFDLKGRTCTVQHSSMPHLVVNPRSTTLSYGDSWAVDELIREMSKDAVGFLCQNAGFIFYRKQE